MAFLVSRSKCGLQLGAKAPDLSAEAQELVLAQAQPLEFFCGYLYSLWLRNRFLSLVQPKPQALVLTPQSQ